MITVTQFLIIKGLLRQATDEVILHKLSGGEKRFNRLEARKYLDDKGILGSFVFSETIYGKDFWWDIQNEYTDVKEKIKLILNDIKPIQHGSNSI